MKKTTTKAATETPQQRVTRLMKANKSKGTKPELLLRSAVWQAGLRGYRLHPKGVPGKPDLAFPGKKLAVFMHGCFWHQCPRCEELGELTPERFIIYWGQAAFKHSRNEQRGTPCVDVLFS